MDECLCSLDLEKKLVFYLYSNLGMSEEKYERLNFNKIYETNIFA